MKIKQVAIVIIAIMTIIIGNMSYAANTTKKTNTVDTEEKEEGLENIEIENAKISPEFKTTKYEYEVKYIGEEEKLQITLTPTEPYYTTKIIGNEDLKEGENLITILVSDANDKNVATYQLKVNKSLVDVEAIAKKEEAKQKAIDIIIIGISLVIIILLVLILSLTKTRTKTKNKKK